MANIEELERRLQALEAEVAALEAGGERKLMRDTLRCPACAHARVLQIDSFHESREWALVCVSHEDIGGMLVKRRHYRGTVQAFACARCGYTEMQLDDAAALVDLGAENVRVLDAGQQPRAGYR